MKEEYPGLRLNLRLNWALECDERGMIFPGPLPFVLAAATLMGCKVICVLDDDASFIRTA